MKTGIDAMLASLDPYTNYISEDRIEDFRTLNTGQYGGIGASTIQIDNKTYISMIFEGYSAHGSKLQIGDQVLAINHIGIAEKSRDDINKLLKGQNITEVVLTVKRYGFEAPMDIRIEREKITIENVPFYGLLKENVGYIKLNEFTQNASRNVKNALKNLKKQGAQGIILDLRGNPGGLLIEAVNISNIFLPKGSAIVSTKGKIEENKFQGHGWHISSASESILTEMVKGKTIDEAKNITKEELFEELGNIIETRIKCALLGLTVLKKGLEEFEKNNRKRRKRRNRQERDI